MLSKTPKPCTKIIFIVMGHQMPFIRMNIEKPDILFPWSIGLVVWVGTNTEIRDICLDEKSLISIYPAIF